VLIRGKILVIGPLDFTSFGGQSSMKKTRFLGVIAAFAIMFFFHSVHAHAQETTYTVQPGDSLSSIAQNVLGDSNDWQELYSLNASQITDPNVIYANEVLQLPLQTSQATAQDAVYSSSSSDNYVSQSVGEQKVPQPTVPVYTPPATNYARGEGAYIGVVDSAAALYGVDPALMVRIIECESGFNPNAYNPSGATGIAQFMPGTYYGSWNIYKDQYPLSSPIGQIYAMALKIHEGDVRAWVCASL
jgi:LysM repeat protein